MDRIIDLEIGSKPECGSIIDPLTIAAVLVYTGALFKVSRLVGELYYPASHDRIADSSVGGSKSLR